MNNEFETIKYRLLSSPYFARVKKGQAGFYIGKIGTDKIVDWRDPKCSIYYQYTMYIGVKDENLKLIRDFSINNGKLFGYVDKFNDEMKNYEKYSDEHLKKVILFNREKKSIHDIIASIQQNQYDIMTQNKDTNMVVLGCAGSGKTMILLHRIAYLIFNNEINQKDIYIISPTKYLANENNILSKTLNIELTNKYTFADFYRDALLNYNNQKKNYCKVSNNVIVNNYEFLDNTKKQFYTKKYLQELSKTILDLNNNSSHDLINKYDYDLKKSKQEFQNHFYDINDFINCLNLYKDFKNNCKSKRIHGSSIEGYLLQDLDGMQLDIQSDKKLLEKLYKYKLILTYFLNNNCFLADDSLFNKAKLDKNNKIEQIINNLPFLSDIVENFEIVEEKLSQEYTKNSEAIERIVHDLMLYKRISNEHIENLFDGLRLLSKDEINYYVNTIDNFFEEKKYINLYKSILDECSKHKEFFTKISVEENKYSTPKYDDFAKNIVEICKIIESKNLNDKFADIEYIFDFFEGYEKIELKERKMELYLENNDYNFMSELIGYYICDNYDFSKEYIISNDYEAFIQCYICEKLFGKLSLNQKYIFIDEFQDSSVSEIMLIKDLYPNAVFNFYGDYNQSITQKEKITNINEIFDGIKEYRINENYRNAYEITEFINKELKMNMMPIGIKGQVINLKYNNYNDIKVSPNDRIVYIFKDNNHKNAEFINHMKINDNPNEFDINNPIALTIQDVKGLEFENVIVDDTDMTENEKYVAYTRALNKLYLIKK